MYLFKWHEKLLRRMSTRNLAFVVCGQLLVWFVLGSLFADGLLRYDRYFLFLGIALFIYYLIDSFLDWHAERKTKYSSFFFGFMGGLLLLLFLGMQFPAMKWQLPLLIFGILLLVPGLLDLVK
jgi:uncharacterized membrane protein YjjP (DUF1212 family)